MSPCASSPPFGHTKNCFFELLQALGNMFSKCGNCGRNNEHDGTDGGVDVGAQASARHVTIDETANEVWFIPTKEEELDLDVSKARLAEGQARRDSFGVRKKMAQDKWLKKMLQGRHASF